MIVFGNELPNLGLHRHIQPDRRLVQKQDLRAVQERRRQLAFHPLAERKFAHLLFQQGTQFQQFRQLASVFL